MKFKLGVAFLGLLTASSAFADGWPSSVTGNWSVIGNQTGGVLVLTQFVGAVGAQCKPIRGTIYGTDAVEGFYCPGSGRISFLRYAGITTVPKQHWSGNLSQSVAGLPLRVGGLCATFDQTNSGGGRGGTLGKYNSQPVK